MNGKNHAVLGSVKNPLFKPPVVRSKFQNPLFGGGDMFGKAEKSSCGIREDGDVERRERSGCAPVLKSGGKEDRGGG